MLNVDDVVEVVELLHLWFKDVVDQAQRVHWLEIAVVAGLIELAHISFRGVEKYALHKRVGPVHLHLHEKLSSMCVLAAHVDDSVLFQRCVGHQFGRKKLHSLYLLPVFEGKQCIKKTGGQVRMLTKDLLKSQVGSWIQIS